MGKKLTFMFSLCVAGLCMSACGKDKAADANTQVTSNAGVEISGTLNISGASVSDDSDAAANAKVGNTAGNLINTGVVCETADRIYYYNRSDANKLYVMNKDGSDKEAVYNIVGATELNVYGDYLYYLSGGIYRVNLKNGQTDRLISENCRNLILCDDLIYYIKSEGDADCIYRCNPDGSDDTKLSANMASSLNVSGEYIYYINGSDSNKVYRMELDGSDDAELCDMKNVQELLVGSGYIYMVSSSSDGSRLYRMARTMHEAECIISDGVSNINMYNGSLYYYNADKNALCYSSANGDDEKELCSGNFNAVNVISSWIYFFDTEDKNFYRVGKDGSNYEIVE